MPFQNQTSENHECLKCSGLCKYESLITVLMVCLSILFLCSQAHCEDIVLTGNQQMVIQNTTYTQTGNIYVRDNAKLTIKNATLILNVSYHEEFVVEVSGSGTLEIDGSTIGISIPGECVIMTFLDTSTLTVKNSDLQKGRVYLLFGRSGGSGGVFQGNASVSNTQFQNMDLNLTTQGAGTIQVSDAAFNSLALRFKDGYTGSFANLKPGYFASWGYSENGYDVSVNRSTIGGFTAVCDSACEVAFQNCEIFQFGVTTPLSSIRMSATDSIIHQPILHGLTGITASFGGLKSGLFGNFKLSEHSQGASLPEISLVNTEVKLWWVVNAFGGSNISVDDSKIEYRLYSSNSTSKITNSTIAYRLMLYNATNSTIEFDNTTIENLDVYVPPNSLTMKGNFSFASNGGLTSWYGPSTIRRTYPVIVFGDSGNSPPPANLSLYDKTGALVWSGQTDAEGKATFDIDFTDNNHNDVWNLAMDFKGIISHRPISLLSPTPIHDCSYTIAPVSKTFTSKPGSGNITVTGKGAKGASCGAPVPIPADPSWIGVTPSAWKNNRYSIKVTVGTNESSSGRLSSIAIADKSVPIVQKGAPCTIKAFSSPSQSVPVTGGPYSFDVSVSPQDCAWTATTNKPWIVLGSASGTGDGTVTYTVPANGTAKSLAGTITVTLTKNGKKKVHTVRQSAK